MKVNERFAVRILAKVGRVAVRELEERQIFPPLFCNKRYRPAIRAFLDARAGLSASPPKAVADSGE